MPRAWSNKDERQFEKVERSQKKRGASAKRAGEIAGRTVNKKRRQEGRPPNRKTQGTGKPSGSLEERSKDELYDLAQKRKIGGRSEMSKGELVKALRG